VGKEVGAHSDYRNGLLARFAGRETLGKEEWHDRFYAGEGFRRTEVFELLDLIEEAYDIPAGLLRPSDPAE
jgi:hypothetical protein